MRGWRVESGIGSEAETAAVVSEDLELFPQCAVNANDHHSHDQHGGGQFREIATISGPLDERAETGSLV